MTPLAAGATPTVTNVGTTTAATFNFGIPAGATGSAGTGNGYTISARNIGNVSVAASNTLNVGALIGATVASGHATVYYVTVPKTGSIKWIEYAGVVTALPAVACTFSINNLTSGGTITGTSSTITPSYFIFSTIVSSVSLAVNVGDQLQVQVAVPSGATTASWMTSTNIYIE